jgi:gamma-glutamyltranspeptidase/glutathione hydrolase
METLAAEPDSFYRGEVGRKIAARVQSAGGILTEQDMADFTVEFTEPVTLDYKGVRLHASTAIDGSICTLETLAILEKLSASAYSSDDPKYWGDLAGALTLAWRDRLAYVGDVPGIHDKVAELISDAHASQLAEMVRSGAVTGSGGGTDTLKETIHLTTCDAEHNMVSLTQTHGGGWGTRFGIPGLGIVIGHGMSRFDPRPGLPNSPGSRKQPLHNMSPLILTKGGELIGSVGLPGGRMIPAVVANLVASIVDFGYSPGQAISAPRIHTQGGVFSYSDTVSQSALDEIKARGHELQEAPRAIGGNVSVIIVDGDQIIGSAQAGKDASLAV